MKQLSKKQTHSYTIDALRVTAILAVILIHSTTKTLSFENFQLEKLAFPLLLNQLSRFAVPLFFLISGFVLELNYKTNLSYINFFKRRTKRVIVPYLFWSVFYFTIIGGQNFQSLFSQQFFDSLLLGKASYQLYFIPTLIIFYLAFPFIHKLMPIVKKRKVFILLALIQIFLMISDYYFKSYNYKQPLRIALLSYLPFIVGMIASHHQDTIYFKAKKYFIPILIFLILLIPIIYFHCKVLILTTHKINYLYSQYHPLNYLYTFTIFVVLFYLFETYFKNSKWILYLSRLSFFVFFVHVWIQAIIWNIVVEGIFVKSYPNVLFSWWFDILLFLAITIISFGIAVIAHKIPYLSKITG